MRLNILPEQSLHDGPRSLAAALQQNTYKVLLYRNITDVHPSLMISWASETKHYARSATLGSWKTAMLILRKTPLPRHDYNPLGLMFVSFPEAGVMFQYGTPSLIQTAIRVLSWQGIRSTSTPFFQRHLANLEAADRAEFYRMLSSFVVI